MRGMCQAHKKKELCNVILHGGTDWTHCCSSSEHILGTTPAFTFVNGGMTAAAFTPKWVAYKQF